MPALWVHLLEEDPNTEASLTLDHIVLSKFMYSGNTPWVYKTYRSLKMSKASKQLEIFEMPFFKQPLPLNSLTIDLPIPSPARGFLGMGLPSKLVHFHVKTS